MTGYLLAIVASVLGAAIVAWALPAWSVRRLMPAFERSGLLVTNYRGSRIPAGLGVAWLVWAAGAAAFQAAVNRIADAPLRPAQVSAVGWTGDLARDTMLLLPPLLVAGAFAFGAIDDVFGGQEAKGFGGHLREMAAGRLTTGGLKLVGIGLLALAAGASATSVNAAISQPALAGGYDVLAVLRMVAAWACASGVIALSANLVNLTDLRPGRALKTYCLLAVIGMIVIGWVTISSSFAPQVGTRSYAAAGAQTPYVTWISVVARLAILSVLALGPVAAVWRLDLRERGMLGDAGANAMGALAGFLMAVRAPLALNAVLLAVLIALNLASERVSFSRVIEQVAFLRWLDGLGRGRASAAGAVSDNGDDDVRAGGSGGRGR